MEQTVTKQLMGKFLVVAVADEFIHHYNLFGRMNAVNIILYEAAGCGHMLN
jgi:hypothetical protein